MYSQKTTSAMHWEAWKATPPTGLDYHRPVKFEQTTGDTGSRSTEGVNPKVEEDTGGLLTEGVVSEGPTDTGGRSTKGADTGGRSTEGVGPEAEEEASSSEDSDLARPREKR